MISLHNGATGVPARPPLNVQKNLTILLTHHPPVPTAAKPFLQLFARNFGTVRLKGLYNSGVALENSSHPTSNRLNFSYCQLGCAYASHRKPSLIASLSIAQGSSEQSRPLFLASFAHPLRLLRLQAFS